MGDVVVFRALAKISITFGKIFVSKWFISTTTTSLCWFLDCGKILANKTNKKTRGLYIKNGGAAYVKRMMSSLSMCDTGSMPESKNAKNAKMHYAISHEKSRYNVIYAKNCDFNTYISAISRKKTASTGKFFIFLLAIVCKNCN